MAHEVGHNLGMTHAMDPHNGGEGGACNKVGGIMSYTYPRKGKWSTCARDEFKKYYNSILAKQKKWCLEEGMYPLLIMNNFIEY